MKAKQCGAWTVKEHLRRDGGLLQHHRLAVLPMEPPGMLPKAWARLMAIGVLLFAMNAAAGHRAIGAEPSRKMDGYHGIWFELGEKTEHGDKYSGGLGTYTTSHVPMAVHSPAANKTFFVYGGTIPGKRHLLAMIGAFDHASGRVLRPTVVHDKKTVDDPHDNPSLVISDDGHLWVFVAGRANIRPGFIYRSIKPYDIDGFELIAEQARMAYPQPWHERGKGFLLLFTMYTKGREEYAIVSPDGRQWPEPAKIVGFGGHYQTSFARDGRVITAFNYHPGGVVNKRTNLYVLRSDDWGQTWTDAAGQPLRTPVGQKHNPAMVHDYEAEKKLVYIQDAVMDARGNPVVLYVVSSDWRPGPLDPPRTWHVARWLPEKRSWQIAPVTTSTHNYDVGALYLESDDCWRIIGPSETGPQQWGAGGEIAVWTSRDQGQTWAKSGQLTHNSLRNHNYVRRPLSAHGGFYGFWADGDTDRFSESLLYFCTKQGRVFVLPRKIEGDSAPAEPYTPAG
mgnify:FL=1